MYKDLSELAKDLPTPELDKCPICREMKPNVSRKSFKLGIGNVGKITSISDMCEDCFNKAKNYKGFK